VNKQQQRNKEAIVPMELQQQQRSNNKLLSEPFKWKLRKQRADNGQEHRNQAAAAAAHSKQQGTLAPPELPTASFLLQQQRGTAIEQPSQQQAPHRVISFQHIPATKLTTPFEAKQFPQKNQRQDISSNSTIHICELTIETSRRATGMTSRRQRLPINRTNNEPAVAPSDSNGNDP
jgi:hypothetical protein